ncbi:peptidase inhibitor family I36 protein [Crossiella sp. CA-258035]|uniref:peptidase inhibitor family I36 protein n=1 Tax=Crossiella sp. CA-258035 TaxID=2981138 RepID=UPI0024BCF287|nr:peptidase inhibitor family I36 protein [Crossiella sp. CA-258035]WHT21585.1 peptidase inhibitor family I36 protein [Crossiella sp. CA-258035]
MSKARLAGAALAAFATAATIGLAGAAPASAALADCPNGHLCIWDGAAFAGKPMYNGPAGGGIVYLNGPFGHMNDRASSLSNKTGRDLCWYEHFDPSNGRVWGRHDHPSYFLDARQLSPNDSLSALGACV